MITDSNCAEIVEGKIPCGAKVSEIYVHRNEGKGRDVVFGISSNTPAFSRVHPSRPAAYPTAGPLGDGVRPPRPGRSESLSGRIHPMSARAWLPVSIGNGVTGGPESVRNGWDPGRKR